MRTTIKTIRERAKLLNETVFKEQPRGLLVEEGITIVLVARAQPSNRRLVIKNSNPHDASVALDVLSNLFGGR